jgi:methionyl-tRNA formyltransferase
MNTIDHICFIGTPEFAVPVLSGLRTTFQNSRLSVITMPDRPKGRGSRMQETPVAALATTHGLPLFKPESNKELSSCITELSPSLIIVVAYGRIIEKTITDRFFCVNIHSSLLPKYRGASPIHTALLNGDKTTGVTLIKMNERMDEGDIVLKKELIIQNNDNLGTLTDALSDLGATACIEFIQNSFLQNQVILTKQDHGNATYSKKIQKSDLHIESLENLADVHDKIRAYAPKPGAYVIHHGVRIKLIESTFSDGVFTLVNVQPEGKTIMSYSDFLRGGGKAIV